MPDKPSDKEAARMLAPLIEVLQRGVMRPATENDILEIISSDGPRYVLKDPAGRYLAHGSRWTWRQTEALVVPDGAVARKLAREGRSHGVGVRSVRLRRKGTVGVEAMRLKPGVKARVDENGIDLKVDPADAMAILAATRGAIKGEGEQ